MSRNCCCCCCCGYGNRYGNSCGYGNRLGNNCGSGCCNFPSFIILILILLQFKGDNCNCEGTNTVDKGILFIIALFYLSCCSPCKSGILGRCC